MRRDCLPKPCILHVYKAAKAAVIISKVLKTDRREKKETKNG